MKIFNQQNKDNSVPEYSPFKGSGSGVIYFIIILLVSHFFWKFFVVGDENGDVNLVRPNREWLLSVRKGQVSYEEIMSLIEEKKNKMDEAFEKSSLPNEVDPKFVHDIILKIRNN